MNSRISKVDVILIIVAILALLGLGAFFMYVKGEQEQQQQQVQQEGAQQLEQVKEQEQLVVAKKEISLTYKKDEAITLKNKSTVSLDISGYSVKLNETLLKIIDEGQVLAPEEGYDIPIKKKTDDALDVVSVYDGAGALLYRYLLSELAEGVSEPTFSVLSGFYDVGFDLTISAPEGSKIYYTTDGTTPGLHSQLYTEPIKVINRTGEAPVFAAKRGIASSEYVPEDVDKCTIVKAIAVNPAGNVSEVKTGIYFVGLSTKLMYSDMPIMVLQAKEDELFDYFEGIFVGGVDYENALAAGENTSRKGNYYRGNIIDASVTLFDDDKKLVYKSDAELAVIADDQAVMGQKSMALITEESVSEDSFASGLFFKEGASVLLNNGKTDYSIKMRQLFAQKIAAQVGIEYCDTVPCAVFLNGEYWGVYLLEGESKSAISREYNFPSENFENNLLVAGEHTNASFQELYDFIASNDMAEKENYEYVCQYIDVANYADYVCLNMYIANAKYGTQTEMWRESNGGKWRFVLPDVSSSMGIGTVNSFSINSFLYPGVSTDKMLQALMCNRDFKKLLVQRMDSLIGIMSDEELINQFIAEEASAYRKPMVASFNRFIRSMSDSGYDSYVQSISNFLSERTYYIQKYTEEFVRVNYKFEPVVVDTEEEPE